jgi:lanthanide-dependent methanol dehydrogenase
MTQLRCKFALIVIPFVFSWLFTDEAIANADVVVQTSNPQQWAIQTGDYANTRYSRLDQITTANVSVLQVAWSFSTGVLRGHEGGPLVVGSVMYVHTPFSNIL